ncbi:hypothetical protein NFJ02_37g93210 [Pycnococcus provasolii]
MKGELVRHRTGGQGAARLGGSKAREHRRGAP